MKIRKQVVSVMMTLDLSNGSLGKNYLFILFRMVWLSDATTMPTIALGIDKIKVAWAGE